MSVVSLIIGSVRPNRNGLRLSKLLKTSLENKGFKVHIIDPLEMNLPVMASRYDWMKDSPNCPPSLHQAAKQLKESDCFVVLAPEYNHSIPPAISNTMDYFYHNEFYYKPSGIVTYSMGSFGGVRAAVALRPFLGELGLVTIPTMLAVPTITKLLNEDGSSTGVRDLQPNIDSFIDELSWYSKSLALGRSQVPLPKD